VQFNQTLTRLCRIYVPVTMRNRKGYHAIHRPKCRDCPPGTSSRSINMTSIAHCALGVIASTLAVHYYRAVVTPVVPHFSHIISSKFNRRNSAQGTRKSSPAISPITNERNTLRFASPNTLAPLR